MMRLSVVQLKTVSVRISSTLLKKIYLEHVRTAAFALLFFVVIKKVTLINSKVRSFFHQIITPPRTGKHKFFIFEFYTQIIMYYELPLIQ